VALAVMPPDGEPGCSCLDFLTSTDQARHLHRLHTPIPAVGGPQTAADPVHRGWFAVLTNPGSSDLRVYRTTDFGRTWHGPTLVGVQGTTTVKPWLAYSPTGQLGVGWRATRPDGSYAFVAAASNNDGRTFYAQVQLSSGWSPAAPPYYVAGDDTSTVTLTRHDLYAAWGDWRGGHLEDVWWGGLRLR
jgi:hypothetical protein